MKILLSPTCHISFLHFTHELMINFEQDNHETHNCVHSMNRESHTVCGCLDSRTGMIICQICFSRGNNSVVSSPIVIQCTPMENLQLTVWEWKAKSHQSVIGKCGWFNVDVPFGQMGGTGPLSRILPWKGWNLKMMFPKFGISLGPLVLLPGLQVPGVWTFCETGGAL